MANSEIAGLPEGEDVSQLNALALIAEKAERHDDMCHYLVQIIKKKEGVLDETERNLFSVAFKNSIGGHRTSWRHINGAENTDCPADILEKYRKAIASELMEKCDQVVDLLSTQSKSGVCIVIPEKPTQEEVEQTVFYLKMKGDYFRYKAEVDPTNAEHGKAAAAAYDKAREHAEKLAPTHPTRLGLALNQSVCYYEILKESNKACDVAKTAFDSAIQKLDTLNDETYKDSTLIMQLLRDNLTLWSSEAGPQQSETQQED